MRIGFIGLGIMGTPMALNLLRSGQPLTVWNRSADKAEPLRAAGAEVAASAGEVFTQADAILDYLVFSRKYVMECEERYGMGEVEEIIDSCHALMDYGVDRYRRPQPMSAKEREARHRERAEYERKLFDDLWHTTVPQKEAVAAEADGRPSRRSRRRTCSTSSRSTRRGSSRGSASSCASCASSRSTSIRRCRPRS